MPPPSKKNPKNGENGAKRQPPTPPPPYTFRCLSYMYILQARACAQIKKIQNDNQYASSALVLLEHIVKKNSNRNIFSMQVMLNAYILKLY